MKELLKQREEVLKRDFKEGTFDKIFGISDPGNKVEIFWKDRDFTDTGYLFSLPEMVPDQGDVFLHITNVDNSDGMDKAPDVHIHLLELASFDRVLKIECKNFNII